MAATLKRWRSWPQLPPLPQIKTTRPQSILSPRLHLFRRVLSKLGFQSKWANFIHIKKDSSLLGGQSGGKVHLVTFEGMKTTLFYVLYWLVLFIHTCLYSWLLLKLIESLKLSSFEGLNRWKLAWPGRCRNIEKFNLLGEIMGQYYKITKLFPLEVQKKGVHSRLLCFIGKQKKILEVTLPSSWPVNVQQTEALLSSVLKGGVTEPFSHRCWDESGPVEAKGPDLFVASAVSVYHEDAWVFII